jgi:histidinol-phosphate aminotransferase
MTARARRDMGEWPPYASPQPDVVARLNTNESPHPLPDGFVVDLTETIRGLPLNRYPDGRMTHLREELSSFVGHPFEGTWVANGSNEILVQLLQAYGGPGRRALIFEPTYLLHTRIAWLTNTGVIKRQLSEPFVLYEETVSDAVAARPDVVFVCSPNNPTGNAQPAGAISSLARSLPDSLVVVDEAYIAIVRTFSKAFALAGARVGYVLADPEVVSNLEIVRLPYHVSSITQAAGIVALKHSREAIRILDSIRAQRDRIAAGLATMPGVKVFASDANFVLFVPPIPAADVWTALVERGVLVRDMSGVVENALRVTAGAPREVDLFLDGLMEVLHR